MLGKFLLFISKINVLLLVKVPLISPSTVYNWLCIGKESSFVAPEPYLILNQYWSFIAKNRPQPVAPASNNNPGVNQ